MKRNIRRVLIGLACAAAALVLVGVQKYYPKYRDFREQTNYRFASIADFFYQLGEARLLSYQFSDQDVSDIEVGSQHISLCTRKPISGGRSEPPIAVEGKAFSSQQQRSGWSS